MISAKEALRRLRDGNRRFLEEVRSHDPLADAARRSELLEGQHPYAIVLGCSDSRVPVETIFDQGLGDLFVIRVAGNIATSSQIGSIEFALDHFGSPLVVVLGHSSCGAIKATIGHLRQPQADFSAGLMSIVDSISPVVEVLLATELRHDSQALEREAVRANVRMSLQRLRQDSGTIERRIVAGELVLAGAEYSLETGEVDFFDGTPDIA